MTRNQRKGEVPLALLLSFFLFAASSHPALFWLVFTCLVPFLFILSKSSSARGAFAAGYGFGLLHSGLVLFWISGVSIPAYAASLLYYALFPGLFSLIYFALRTRRPSGFAHLAAPFLWTGIEWFRAAGFWGMPAGDLGYQLFPCLSLTQGASILGVNGLSFWIAAVNVLLLRALTGNGRKRLVPAIVAAVSIALIGGAGWFRLRHTMWTDWTAAVVAQGNLSPEKKWNAEFLEEAVSIHETVSKPPFDESTRLVIWPETAVPAFLFHPERSAVLERVKAFVRSSGKPLLTGAQDFVEKEGKKFAYNSAVLFSAEGEPLARYRKLRLFPIMEKAPAAWMLPYLKARGFPAQYSEGSEFTRFESGGVTFGVMICFESLFSGLARRFTADGAGLLVNLTNDAVALGGREFFYRQAAQITAFRAIENGRSVIRAANNGYSLAVDPAGRILKMSGLGTRELLTFDVPVSKQKTFFTSFGYFFPIFCAALLTAAAVLAFFRGKAAFKP